MAYATSTSVLVILPGLPQTTTTEGYTASVAIIDAHIVRADSLINSKCANRYDVPFSAVPAIIKTISEDVSVYLSYRSFYTQDNQNRTEYFEELRDRAYDWLEQVSDGSMKLVDSSGNLIAERASTSADFISSNTEDYHSFFDFDDCTNWGFDSDMLDAIDRG